MPLQIVTLNFTKSCLRTTKILPLFFLIATTIGCEKPEFIDFDTTPPEERFDSQKDTLAITVNTAPEDEVEVWNGLLAPESRGFGIEYLGTHYDPVFGITNASVATQIDLPMNNIKFGDNPVADSAVFIIRYDGGFYGNLNTPQTFNIYEVTEELVGINKYYSNSTIQTDNTLLGTWTGTPNPADTTFRIKIDKTFADKVIQGDEDDYRNQQAFKRHINGLYIKPENPGLAQGEGALITTRLRDNQSQLIIYYSNDEKDGLEERFPIVRQSIRLTLTERDYSGTEIENQLQNPGPHYQKAFLQPIGGVKAHISLPGLRDFTRDNPELVIIHRARLTVPRYTGNPSDTLSPPNMLFMFRSLSDTANDFINNIPDKLTPSTFGGDYSEEKNEYTFHITRYIQEEYQAMLADTAYANKGLNILVPSNFVERLVIPAHNTSQGSPVRLEIIYSKVE